MYPILTLSLALFVLTSCSSDDKDPDPAVIFTSLDTNKKDVYTEEKITLNIDGSGYSDIEVSSSNTDIKITKVSTTIYEISSSKATIANIYVKLKNNTYNALKTVVVNFYEHGIKNFTTVEGIKVNVDLSSKIITLLGEPENKTVSTTNSNTEFWSYPSKGIVFAISKNTNLVDNINAYSSNFFTTLENGTKVYYKNYPYEIGNGWYINNPNTTMDAVITKLGTPLNKYSSTTDPTSTLRTYRFATQNMYLGFYSETEDNYTGKTIRSIILY